jgi:hypothetical protein
MRAAVLLILLTIILCYSSAQGDTFIFKTGKKIEGSMRYQDEKTIRIIESSGLEMTLRKSEIDQIVIMQSSADVSPAGKGDARTTPVEEPVNKPVKVFTNRDLKVQKSARSLPTGSISKLERDLARLAGACRAAGGGSRKVLRTHTYRVKGRAVTVTGYWADPGNLEEAKEICRNAIETEEALQQAHAENNSIKGR